MFKFCESENINTALKLFIKYTITKNLTLFIWPYKY